VRRGRGRGGRGRPTVLLRLSGQIY